MQQSERARIMMTSLRKTVCRAAGRVRRARDDERGISAIEFALIVPIMITLYMGVVELSHALTVDRRVTSVASVTADLVAQAEELTDADITDIFNAATSVMQPYSATPLSIVVTSVVADENNATTVAWSRALNGTAHPKDSAFTVPTGLTQPFSSVIVAEVSYTYTPVLGEFITGSINLTDTFYLRPRRTMAVCLNGC